MHQQSSACGNKEVKVWQADCIKPEFGHRWTSEGDVVRSSLSFFCWAHFGDNGVGESDNLRFRNSFLKLAELTTSFN